MWIILNVSENKKRSAIQSVFFDLVGVVRLELTLPEGTRFCVSRPKMPRPGDWKNEFRRRGKISSFSAANRVDLSSATPMEMFTQTAEFGEEDQQTIIDNTNREVWGYNTQATLYDMAAKQAKKVAKRNTISTILGNGSNLLFSGANSGWFGGGIEDMSGYNSHYNPATTVPGRKPRY